MIDASTFAFSFNAFWHASAPTCEHFVRRLNLSGLERQFAPMSQVSKTRRRALIAEYAFSLFVERRRGGKTFADLTATAQAKRAWAETVHRLAPYSAQGLDIETPLDEQESTEVAEIAERLARVFDHSKTAVLRPVFPGCGYVDASEGDVIFGSTLFEVKTVDRPVRSSDIRQTLTYAALNAVASDPFDIRSIGLFNPRRGQFCDVQIDYICSEIAGRPAQELFDVIVQALSSGEISR